ncbi:MAG: ABC transporter ATP-binding protein [Deltaproteobacteria bacterium]|nr:ABC transporter ATP-binding protein [Deltaproteobacteria bacterium]
MSDIALRADRLGKKYRLGQRENYFMLRDVLARSMAGPLRRLFPNRQNVPAPPEPARVEDSIWALKDVSFEIKQGDVVGIVGRNGAGKSTLLKILSRIIEPTEGEARIYGRIGSLLEVGTGFHPELTGRENVYLSGAILGMRKSEIEAKFDEIVAFAEVEKFIDMVVKHYSTGMYLRLGFAVAAHLEPEILIVDEVLAVGDAAFQEKCLGKMGDVAKHGRTVLFVSHNMAALQVLCTKALLIESGTVQFEGDSTQAISRYLRSVNAELPAAAPALGTIPRQNGSRAVFVQGSLNGRPLATAHCAGARERLDIELSVALEQPVRQCSLEIAFETEAGLRVYAIDSRWTLKPMDLAAGDHELHCALGEIPLVPGRYFISLGFAGDGRQADWLYRIAAIEIAATDVYGTGELPLASQGYFLSEATWRIGKARLSGKKIA